MAKQKVNGDQLGNTGSSWTTWTPTITAGSGTFTSVTATGRYKQIGKTVFYRVSVIFTTIGTGNGPLFSLPVTSLASGGHIGACREDATTGYSGTVKLQTTGKASFAKYDNGNILSGGNGSTVIASRFYEAS